MQHNVKVKLVIALVFLYDDIFPRKQYTNCASLCGTSRILASAALLLLPHPFVSNNGRTSYLLAWRFAANIKEVTKNDVSNNDIHGLLTKLMMLYNCTLN